MGRIGNWLSRISLFLLYAVLRRRLQLQWISAPPPVIFLENVFTMRWQLSGCYKIEVNNKVILPGTTNFVQLDSQQMDRSLHLTFYGYNQKTEKVYQLRIVSSPVKQNISLLLEPNRFPVPKIAKYLSNLQMESLYCIRCPLPVNLPAIHPRSELFAPKAVALPQVNIQLEPFNPQ
jgi:hypothetical protein